MGKFVDLTGKRIGKLIVIKRAEDSVSSKGKYATQWLCKCDCGNNKNIKASSLNSGGTRSCGCAKQLHLLGKVFGRLTVIDFDYIDKNKGSYWICSCECGTKKSIQGSSLTKGNTASCGCLSVERSVISREKFLEKDMVGRRFGRLVVLNREYDPNFTNIKSKYSWKCLCDCGSETFVQTSSLKNGSTKSCGCLRGELLAKKNKENGYKLRKGKYSVYRNLLTTYKRNAKNRNLEFDISDDEFKRIVDAPCFYCGKFDKKKNNYSNISYDMNGIDRITSKKGYTKDNVVSSCGRCNQAKMSESQQDFFDWHKQSIIHQSKSWTDEETEEFINQIREARKYKINNDVSIDVDMNDNVVTLVNV